MNTTTILRCPHQAQAVHGLLSPDRDYTLAPATAPDGEFDGYTLRLEGKLAAGQAVTLTFTAFRHASPVTDLQPYLAAYGHLFALRTDDQDYLRVHPNGGPGDGTTRPGPEITFHATATAPGPCRLYLDVRHNGRVHTAEFTAIAA
ncbi:hypothetical protein [Streptomyces sp. NPDC002671]